MLLRLGYDMQFDIPEPVACVAQLRVHPSRAAVLREPDLVATCARDFWRRPARCA
jgi:hypothetical protein